MNFSPNATSSQAERLELIQAIDKLLATATQAAGNSIGVKPVISLLQFSGIYDSLAPQPSPTLAEILGEVEQDAGIEITFGLVVLIKNSPYQNVRDTIAIYVKTYGKSGGKNPRGTGLFYRILETENLRKSKVQI